MLKHIFLVLAFLVSFQGSSQSNGNGLSRNVSGIVWDSAYNFALESATVVAYMAEKGDSAVLSYTLTNNEGKYTFEKLPVGKKIKVLVSYSGYSDFSLSFTIASDTATTTLDKINLTRNDVLMDGVIIESIVPVRMNGDTLEFNPRAFKLDENAVVEDLLKVLPGMTIWSDGSITINGREVSSVLVNGKPFFGGNAKVATQNLSKNSVNKVQVYSSPLINNPLDSMTIMNIKLKKGFKEIFGKAVASQGTDHRRELGLVLNGHTASTQIGVGGNFNNMNRSFKSMSDLLQNTTFKGGGANIDYQSNFEAPGITKSVVGGLFIQHDFSNKVDYEHLNRLNANYFVNKDSVIVDKSIVTEYNVNQGNLIRNKKHSISSDNLQHRFEVAYDKITPYKFFSLKPFIILEDLKQHSSELERTISEFSIVQNTSQVAHAKSTTRRDWGFDGLLQNKSKIQTKNNSPTSFSVNTSLVNSEINEKANSQIKFESATDPTNNRYINRLYEEEERSTKVGVDLEYPGIHKLVGINSVFSKLDLGIGLVYGFEFRGFHNDVSISDYDTTENTFRRNLYLSNRSFYQSTKNKGGFFLTKSVSKGLSSRYSKDIFVRLDLKAQYFNQQNESQKTFQTLNSTKVDFIPNILFEYKNQKFSVFTKVYQLELKKSIIFPTVEQLFPLIDSINLMNIYVGNPDLTTSVKRELNVSFSNQSNKRGAYFSYNMALAGGIIRNAISDSTYSTSSGLIVHPPINIPKNSFLNFSGGVKKAIKGEGFQAQIQLSPVISFTKTKKYLNSDFVTSNVIILNNLLKFSVSIRDALSAELSHHYNYYKIDQSIINKSFYNKMNRFILSLSHNVNKKMNYNLTASRNENTSAIAPDVKFMLVNASVGCKLLKSNQAEIRLAAYDVFRQNKSVISEATNNSLSIVSSNVLQQFFALTISYYPRITKKNL